MKLTIAIPTFNRNEILKKNIKFLLPQLTDDCTLLVIDNCSPIPVEDTLNGLFSEYPALKYKVHRNITNIGGNANILRCIEFCETEWLWILGDDDIPEPDAVKIIMKNVDQNQDITFINFYCPDPFHPKRKKNIYTKGLENYLTHVDALAPSIFISSNVYRLTDVKKYLSIAMFYQYSCAPQWIILLLSLHDIGQCIISSEVIVRNGSKGTPMEDIVSPIPIANGLPVLLTLPIPFKSKLLVKKIIIQASKEWVSAERILLALLIEAKKTNDVANAVLKYRHIRMFFLNLNPNPVIRIKCWLYGWALRFPGLTLSFISSILKMIGSNYQVPSIVRKQVEPVS
jgi:glycosyltransferase involved in cell wall biosynthesis